MKTIKTFVLLVFPVIFMTGCYKDLYPEKLSDKGVYPADYPKKILVSISEDFVAERYKVSGSEKDLAVIEENGTVVLTQKVVTIKKNTPGTVDKTEGDKIYVNFGKPVGYEKEPEIILPMIRVKGSDTESFDDDLYELFINPLFGTDDQTDRIELSYTTTYEVIEGLGLNATYKEYEKTEHLKAKGKKPGQK